MRRGSIVAAAGLLIVALATPAGAIVKVPIRPIAIYEKSQTVATGKIVRLDGAAGALEITVGEVWKGASAGRSLKVIVKEAADFPREAAVGGPAIVLVGARTSLLHAGDQWLVAGLPEGNVPTLAVGPMDAAYLAQLKFCFPGRTPMLLRLMADIRDGYEMDLHVGRLYKPDQPLPPRVREYEHRGPIVDDMQHKGFGGFEMVQDLGMPNPTRLWSGDLDKGDITWTKTEGMKVDLLVANGRTVKLFRPGKRTVRSTYDLVPVWTDQTAAWGLDKARPCRQLAIGDLDGDGVPDLLLGSTYVLRRGSAFGVPAALGQLPPDDQWVGAAIADSSGDGRCDIVVLLADGTLITLTGAKGPPETWAKSTRRLWEGGPRKAWAVFSREWSGTGELCAIVVRAGNVTRYSCGPGETVADDLERLCGTPIGKYYGFTTMDLPALKPGERVQWGRTPVTVKPGTPVHPLKEEEIVGVGRADFNGRFCTQDLLLITRNGDGFLGGMPLGYRGYGAFIYNRGTMHTIHALVKRAGADLVPGTLVAMGDQSPGKGTRQHLLLLTPKGQLWQVYNMGG